MKTALRLFLALLLPFFLYNCNSNTRSEKVETQARKTVEMVTDHGTMLIELYNETPLHRDNFLKLAREGVYDSLLFHRVIENFMIQGGDPDSKNAQPGDTLGNGEFEYRVDAEFNPNLFHKKGVLAAARDGNPERASSSTQFYIVQGKVLNDSLLDRAEKRINTWLAAHYFKKDPANKELVDALQKAVDDKNMEGFRKYNDSITRLSGTYENYEPYTIPESHRKVYRTTGGTPHLDQNYTVFGEVVQGIEVIDSIAKVKTDPLDRPLSDVRIRSVRESDQD